ncbi:uncharacterized protein LOC141596666 [Silene latifolia]|uniref:uncharacterized protein LOC141596666 n=1 Tax=Silene latifolia TaxID=37657 RepID=UPI003D77F1A6
MSIKTLSPLYPSSGGSSVYEMYTVQDNGIADTYTLQGSELNPRLPSPFYANIETMNNDRTSEYMVDPSLYYPNAAGYGYYCSGFESSGEWDEQHSVFGSDGADVQYMAQGTQAESLPYIYYTPNYGYGESPFNPYNPYIPGAMIGADGSCIGTQPYYLSPYSDPVTSPGYFPVLVQSGTNALPNSSTDTISDVGPSTMHRANAASVKRSYAFNPASSSVKPSKATSSQTNTLKAASHISEANVRATRRSVTNNGHGVSATSHMPQSASTSSSLQSVAKLLPKANPSKFSYPAAASLSEYASSTNGQAIMSDSWSNFYHRKTFTDLNGGPDPLIEQNRGPRTNKSKNQIIVKAYTTKATNCNSEGNIVISADQYNKDDFPLEYADAKFFVIKSYSEDDVHKSIKYNVWSSTPNGNKKLNCAYEDAQKAALGKPRGCPIFLFFSVNASGQFCGVAQMLGPVDFDKDMDFWQQDKWSGSFPVKWHIIKDAPNPTFRHIILENNEHKPVTNSRDTQEILYKPGLEMLKVFKNYTSRTSLLDDFIYYENRQKIMYEERARLLRRANGHAHVHQFQQPIKVNYVADRSVKEDGVGSWVEKIAQSDNSRTPEKPIGSSEKFCAESTRQSSIEVKPVDNVSTLKIGSLSIHPKHQTEQNPPTSASAPAPRTTVAPANVVTVGSIPVKVDVGKSSGMLTIGTIPLDPKALKKGVLEKSALQN